MSGGFVTRNGSRRTLALRCASGADQHRHLVRRAGSLSLWRWSHRDYTAEFCAQMLVKNVVQFLFIDS